MNIKELKEYIKGLPDDMEVGRYDSDNICDKKVEEVTIEQYPDSWLWFTTNNPYLNFK